MIHVQESSLCPLEEELLACLDILVEDEGRICYIFPQDVGVPGVLLVDLLEGERLIPQELLQDEVLLRQLLLELTGENCLSPYGLILCSKQYSRP